MIHMGRRGEARFARIFPTPHEKRFEEIPKRNFFKSFSLAAGGISLAFLSLLPLLPPFLRQKSRRRGDKKVTVWPLIWNTERAAKKISALIKGFFLGVFVASWQQF